MNKFPYLNAWLQCLWHLVPPRGLIHVGAGCTNTLDYPYIDAPRLLVAEADIQNHTKLTAQLKTHSHAQLMHSVISAEPGAKLFYTLSQSNESGLCHPTSLQALWPNIRAVRTELIESTTLQSLLASTSEELDNFNWVVIDCLPAGDVIKSVGGSNKIWDVVVLRATKEKLPCPDQTPHCLSLTDIRNQMSTMGLDYLAMEEENHPQMVRALFVRRTIYKLEQEIEKSQSSHAELIQTQKELAAQLGAEIQERRNAVKQLDEQRQQLDEQNKQLDEQNKRLEETLAALSAVQARNDTLAKERLKLIAEYTEAIKARDDLSRQRDAASEAELKANDKYEEQRKILDELQASNNVQNRENADKIERIQLLETANKEYAARQQIMHEELVKAETQIELIREFLFRSPEQ